MEKWSAHPSGALELNFPHSIIIRKPEVLNMWPSCTHPDHVDACEAPLVVHDYLEYNRTEPLSEVREVQNGYVDSVQPHTVWEVRLLEPNSYSCSSQSQMS